MLNSPTREPTSGGLAIRSVRIVPLRQSLRAQRPIIRFMAKRKIYIDGPEPAPRGPTRRSASAKTPSKRVKQTVAAVCNDADRAATAVQQTLDSHAALAISGLGEEVGCTTKPAAKRNSPLPKRPRLGIAGCEAPDTHAAQNRACPCNAAAYADALMKIKVPLAVVLAEKRMPLERILRIAPGAVLKFDKPCTEPLEVEVGGRRIAAGETVTVGEQLGSPRYPADEIT